MWSDSSSANISHPGALALALLLSGLLHALAIVFPYFDEVVYGEAAVASGAPIRRAEFSVTLNHSAAGEQKALLVVKAPPARPEPGSGDDHSAKKREEPAPAMISEVRQNILPLPGIDYYATNALTVKPKALGEAALDPEEIAAIVATGRVVLLLRINEQGEVVDVSVEHSDLPDVFSETAAKAFRKLRFAPGELDGRKVGAVMRIEVRYDDDRLPAP